MAPEKAVVALAPPVVKVTAAAALSVIVPEPAREPMLTELPARSRVEAPATDTAELLPNAVADPACNVPALTVVAPV